jgi:hypothetical protein
MWFMPDGRRLLVRGERSVHLIDLATAQPVYAPLVHAGALLARLFHT